jgi:alpha-tubulin suppressor-like RCC1 family protein
VLGLNVPVSDTFSSPVQVGALTTWLSIDVWYQALAIKTDETLWVWGRNDQGQLGLSSTIASSSPVQVGSDTWSTASAGGLHSVAVSSSGELYAAGYNAYGQLGQNNTTASTVFAKIGSDTNWSKVAAGYGNTFAVKTDGTLWAFGSNQNGSLGIGLSANTERRSSPVQVGALTNWLQPSSAYNITAVVKTNGQLWTWGMADYGQLGLNDLFSRSSPVQVGALTNWAQVSVGSFGVTGAIKTNGTLWAWGRNNNGQVGNNQTINKSSPIQIGSLTNWAYVSAGNGNMLAVKTDGTLWSWGSNSEGRGGTNDSPTIRRSSPVQVGTLTTWDKVAASAISNGSVHAITRSDT